MMNSGILNRLQFWMDIDFSETHKLIAIITVAYTKTMISKNKQALLVEVLLAGGFKCTNTRTIISNKMYHALQGVEKLW